MAYDGDQKVRSSLLPQKAVSAEGVMAKSWQPACKLGGFNLARSPPGAHHSWCVGRTYDKTHHLVPLSSLRTADTRARHFPTGATTCTAGRGALPATRSQQETHGSGTSCRRSCDPGMAARNTVIFIVWDKATRGIFIVWDKATRGWHPPRTAMERPSCGTVGRTRTQDSTSWTHYSLLNTFEGPRGQPLVSPTRAGPETCQTSFDMR
jgi:hypothetical protein